MKKGFLLISASFLGYNAFAQLPVSTAEKNKVVVLEEFTGVRCQYCPDGHKRAVNLKKSKGEDKVVLVNIHTGLYATPANGWLNLTSSDGDNISKITGMNITGYPTGSVNRVKFQGQSGFAINRGTWTSVANQILNEKSYVNVATQGWLNKSTRELTVRVEVYYTADALKDNKLTVMILEDSILGKQIGGQEYFPENFVGGEYNHMHVMRDVITTSYLGEDIGKNTKGQKITKEYKYTIPEKYNDLVPKLENLHLVAFIAEGDDNILTGDDGPISEGNAPTSIEDIINGTTVKVYPNPVNGSKLNVNFNLNKSSNIAIEMTDVLGRVVRQAVEKSKLSVGEHNIALDVTDLPKGFYSVTIKSESNQISTKVIVD